MYVCVHVYAWCLKRSLDNLEFELEKVMSHHTWGWELNASPLQEGECSEVLSHLSSPRN